MTATYITIQSGIVRRTFGDAPFAEITLLRVGAQQPTYQGLITAVAGGWRATGAAHGDATVDLGTFVDWLDAEAALLKRRTGVRATVAWDGPRPVAPQRVGTEICTNCGWDKPINSECLRLDLHWTPVSLAAEDEARRARRALARA
ncbi:MAG TPA: hypothetical protein VK453_25840 [Micromonosporaceae bacterium]|nr:hypothetical protein [Micromonosporaceae bacterium]